MSFCAQTMEEFLGFIIPGVFSCLDVRDVCRCACTARGWASCVYHMLSEMMHASAKARAQVDKDRITPDGSRCLKGYSAKFWHRCLTLHMMPVCVGENFVHTS